MSISDHQKTPFIKFKALQIKSTGLLSCHAPVFFFFFWEKDFFFPCTYSKDPHPGRISINPSQQCCGFKDFPQLQMLLCCTTTDLCWMRDFEAAPLTDFSAASSLGQHWPHRHLKDNLKLSDEDDVWQVHSSGTRAFPGIRMKFYRSHGTQGTGQRLWVDQE